jgi:hypothetical protein
MEGLISMNETHTPPPEDYRTVIDPVDLDPRKIDLDPDVMARVKINEETVREYVEVWKNRPQDFPPVRVFFDGQKFRASRGWHRILAARKAKVATIKAEVRMGGVLEATLARFQH